MGKVAFLLANDFEDSEMKVPYDEVIKAGHKADIIGFASICHGPQILISADLLKGRTITAYPPLKDDVVNAGAEFKDEEVVVDRNYITSRTPKDEPAFVREILKVLK